MTYYVGDSTTIPFVIEPSYINPELSDSVNAALVKPDGTTVNTAAVIADDQIEVTLPVLDAAGVWLVQVTLVGTAGSARLPGQRFLVEAATPDGWYDTATTRAQWRDAPDDDVALWELLEVAKDQVLSYAGGVGGPGFQVPPNLRKAQLMQARNIWNAAKVDASNGEIGEDTFAIRPFPLDWAVRQMIRPKRALPWVG